jgi:hypothetical protein
MPNNAAVRACFNHHCLAQHVALCDTVHRVVRTEQATLLCSHLHACTLQSADPTYNTSSTFYAIHALLHLLIDVRVYSSCSGIYSCTLPSVQALHGGQRSCCEYIILFCKLHPSAVCMVASVRTHN